MAATVEADRKRAIVIGCALRAQYQVRGLVILPVIMKQESAGF
jgi:hypothetical protein